MIYIIRHGQTVLNQRQVLQGRSDHPLNEVGIRQAQEAAVALGSVSFDHAADCIDGKITILEAWMRKEA